MVKVFSIGWILAAPGVLGGLIPCVGCGSNDGQGAISTDSALSSAPTSTSTGPDLKLVDGGPGCADAMAFFAEQVWGPVVKERCFFCHYAEGPAGASRYVLVTPADAGDWEVNFAGTCAMALLDNGGASQLLLKPTYKTDHGGGLRVAPGSDEYAILEAFVNRAEDLEGCLCTYSVD